MPSAPVAFPVGSPTVTGTSVTLDVLLNQPTRLTRTIADIATQKFFADRVFTPAGGITGGAVLFEQPPALTTDLYAERDVQEVAPGNEFPLLSFLRGQPIVARPRKIGGKWFVTREARLRNDVGLLQRYMRQTANTILRKTEQMAQAELSANATNFSRFIAGQSWATAAAVTMFNRSGVNQPLADITTARHQVDIEERGIVLDSIVIHPDQALNLTEAYGAGELSGVLDSVGISNVYVTPRQTAGTALLFADGMVGEWRNEFPLLGELEEEGVADGGRQRTWYQWSISPSMYVTDPYALLEIRGIG